MPRTLTAMFADRTAAENARNRLIDAGIPGSEIDIQDQGAYGAPSGDAAQSHGFLDELKGLFGGHEDHRSYATGVARGHVLLAATVMDEETSTAISVLDASGALDLDRHEAEWGQASASGQNSAFGETPRAQTGPLGEEPVSRGPLGETSGRGAALNDAAYASSSPDETLQVAEERLVVGKREVERGGIRVRSYIVETPVSESVALRQERLSVDRRSVDRPIAAGEDVFQDRVIELRETAEEAVVGKEARVIEEIGIHKEVGQRTEEIRDTVRHTEVEVDRTGGSRDERDLGRPL